jgi:hypothetical protein
MKLSRSKSEYIVRPQRPLVAIMSTTVIMISSHLERLGGLDEITNIDFVSPTTWRGSNTGTTVTTARRTKGRPAWTQKKILPTLTDLDVMSQLQNVTVMRP